jgi:hypothetical protein
MIDLFKQFYGWLYYQYLRLHWRRLWRMSVEEYVRQSSAVAMMAPRSARRVSDASQTSVAVLEAWLPASEAVPHPQGAAVARYTAQRGGSRL